MNAFISHSMKDKGFIEMLRDLLRRNGVTPLIAEDDVSLSETISKKVERYISQSQLAVVVLTRNGSSSRFVQQEIGYLESREKPMLLLVEKGLENEVTGFIRGRDFITVDPADLDAALKKAEEKIVSFVRKWWKGIAFAVFLVLVAVIVWAVAKN